MFSDWPSSCAALVGSLWCPRVGSVFLWISSGAVDGAGRAQVQAWGGGGGGGNGLKEKRAGLEGRSTVRESERAREQERE